MKIISDYHRQEIKRTWCPGCGNFGIESALKLALAGHEVDPGKAIVVGGIGCGGLMPYWVKTNTFIGLHGRALPAAIGMGLTDPGARIIVMAGDGDAYGIGLGHLAHAFRRNQKLVYLVSNNGVYGLTKGQASPTADLGTLSPSTPDGTELHSLDPILLELALGGTFVARGFAGDIQHLSSLIAKAMAHEGFAFIDILQPCVSYHKKMCDPSYAQSLVKIDESHNPLDLGSALEIAKGPQGKKTIGLFYQQPAGQAIEKNARLFAGERPVDFVLSLIDSAKVR